MSERPEITVDVLIEYWRRQVGKLTEAGVPLERVADSIRTAALEVENNWFVSIVEEGIARLEQATAPLKLVHGEGGPE